MKKTNGDISCADIYEKIINESIKTNMHFQEKWMNVSRSYEKEELFRYGDEDFYFYRFAVGISERNTQLLLNKIICDVSNRYNVNILVAKNPSKARFKFVIKNKNQKIGYVYEDFYDYEDVNSILRKERLTKACIIRTIKSDENEHIHRQNENYARQGIKLSEITIKDFFAEYFSEKEYEVFEKYIGYYIKKIREILGMQTIKFLSPMNYANLKISEESILANWEYKRHKFHIINRSNDELSDVLYLANVEINQELFSNYIGYELYKAMVGKENFAKSFITSEWLFHSLKDKKNFDYTSIINGYLKSVEQLLHKLIMLNINNDCIISTFLDEKMACEKGLCIYDVKYNNEKKITNKKEITLTSDKFPKHPYIDFVTETEQYISSSIGTYEFFLKYNKHIFSAPEFSKVICDMVKCFRIECRNPYFHLKNLDVYEIVKETRENAILLYAILLGGIKKSKLEKNKIGIITLDKFDMICKEIRHISNYSIEFYFEYKNGDTRKMIYDNRNNIINYSEDGVEHYDNILFFEVNDFSINTYEELDEWAERNKQHFNFNKDNMPDNIYIIDKEGKKHEISIDLN